MRSINSAGTILFEIFQSSNEIENKKTRSKKSQFHFRVHLASSAEKRPSTNTLQANPQAKGKEKASTSTTSSTHRPSKQINRPYRIGQVDIGRFAYDVQRDEYQRLSNAERAFARTPSRLTRRLKVVNFPWAYLVDNVVGVALFVVAPPKKLSLHALLFLFCFHIDSLFPTTVSRLHRALWPPFY